MWWVKRLSHPPCTLRPFGPAFFQLLRRSDGCWPRARWGRWRWSDPSSPCLSCTCRGLCRRSWGEEPCWTLVSTACSLHPWCTTEKSLRASKPAESALSQVVFVFLHMQPSVWGCSAVVCGIFSQLSGLRWLHFYCIQLIFNQQYCLPLLIICHNKTHFTAPGSSQIFYTEFRCASFPCLFKAWTRLSSSPWNTPGADWLFSPVQQECSCPMKPSSQERRAS